MQDHRNGGSYWVLPGGAIDGAVREVREETGLTVTIDRLLYVVDSVEPGVPQLCYTFYFVARMVSGVAPTTEFVPERDVVKAARFFAREELASLPRVWWAPASGVTYGGC